MGEHKYNKSKNRAQQEYILIAVMVLCGVIVLGGVIYLLFIRDAQNPTRLSGQSYPVRIDQLQEVEVELGHDLQITDMAQYAGVYMEDGSNEIVTGLLLIVVKNTGKKDIQYAEIEIPVGDTTAYFTLTTLPAGESVVLLEKNRMPYTDDADMEAAVVKKVAPFQEPMSCQEDKLKIQVMDGVLNVTNISGQDITGDVVIYYKNSASDMLYGGITYRVSIQGGLKKGELKQVPAGHFTTNGSRIMFVTCG